MLLYKYRAIERLDFIGEILVSQNLFCALPSQLNDPFEGAFGHSLTLPGIPESPEPLTISADSHLEDICESDDPILRVCSLAATATDVRLWSYYAGDCRGVAIEIDFEGVKEVVRIKYAPTLQQFDDTEVHYGMQHRVLAQKTTHWEHEQEFRVLTFDRHFSINGRIRRVILGPRCSKIDRDIVERLLPDGATLAHARPKRSRAELEIVAG